jgi:hypothetical protein
VNHCLRHYEEPVTAHCRTCQHPFCARCLVYSFGPKKPPYCVGCALHAAGVRNGNRSVVPPTGSEDPEIQAPPLDKRAERAERRAQKEAAKAAARAAKKAARRGEPITPTAPVPEAARSSQVPAPSQLLARSTTTTSV